MKERNTSTVAVITVKYNNLCRKCPLAMDRKTLEWYLRDRGFHGDFSSLIPIMLAEHILFREEGQYFLPSEETSLNTMRRIMKKYRERNHDKYMRKIHRQCEEYAEFLRNHGYVVMDDILANAATTNVYEK